MRFALFLVAAAAIPAVAKYWMEDIAHQGLSPFNPDKSYQVFRNVKDFGAVGDGVTDDTKAINAAISSGKRCGGEGCTGTTTTPATVYFPKGTYIISSTIDSFYYTQLIGDPTSMPVIKAAKNFKAGLFMCLIDANQYLPQKGGLMRYGDTNLFYRSARNLVLDMRDVPGETCGIHWPSSQATSIHNVVFKMSDHASTEHSGIFMEKGSGGMLSDLVFHGGLYGAQFGNQQYTAHNLTFHGAKTAIHQLWSWGWTYKSITIHNCDVGINVTRDDVGAITLIDSHFTNVGIGIITRRDSGDKLKPGAASLVMDNVRFTNVTTVIKGPKGDKIHGSLGTTVVSKDFAYGNVYSPSGPQVYEKTSHSLHFPRPGYLMAGNEYYARSKPQYDSTPVTSFMSARSYGAKGDGVTDDTKALNKLFKEASGKFDKGAVAFLDAGYYLVTDTIYFPPNLRVVGEAMSSVILAAGAKFSDINTPYPVVQVGKPGEKGYLEWSDTFISTQGATAGAVLVEYNLATETGNKCKLTAQSLPPSGLWDVHTRIGGFAGSKLQIAQCPTTPHKENAVNPACIAAYMSFHLTKSSTGVYLENNWLWVADHDIEDPNATQITIFAGRGLLVESTAGRIWLVGTGSEHHVLYQFQLVNTKNIWMGQVQSETAYHQPNPPAPLPFSNVNEAIFDPDFRRDCPAETQRQLSRGDELAATRNDPAALTFADIPGKPPCQMGWGLRIISSRNVVVYGAGLYSFFNNWNTSCSRELYKTADGDLAKCQARIFEVDRDPASSVRLNISMYNLNTVGVVSMITTLGNDRAIWKDNKAGFADTVAVFRFKSNLVASNGNGTIDGALVPRSEPIYVEPEHPGNNQEGISFSHGGHVVVRSDAPVPVPPTISESSVLTATPVSVHPSISEVSVLTATAAASATSGDGGPLTLDPEWVTLDTQLPLFTLTVTASTTSGLSTIPSAIGAVTAASEDGVPILDPSLIDDTQLPLFTVTIPPSTTSDLSRIPSTTDAVAVTSDDGVPVLDPSLIDDTQLSLFTVSILTGKNRWIMLSSETESIDLTSRQLSTVATIIFGTETHATQSIDLTSTHQLSTVATIIFGTHAQETPSIELTQTHQLSTVATITFNAEAQQTEAVYPIPTEENTWITLSTETEIQSTDPTPVQPNSWVTLSTEIDPRPTPTILIVVSSQTVATLFPSDEPFVLTDTPLGISGGSLASTTVTPSSISIPAAVSTSFFDSDPAVVSTSFFDSEPEDSSTSTASMSVKTTVLPSQVPVPSTEPSSLTNCTQAVSTATSWVAGGTQTVTEVDVTPGVLTIWSTLPGGNTTVTVMPSSAVASSQPIEPQTVTVVKSRSSNAAALPSTGTEASLTSDTATTQSSVLSQLPAVTAKPSTATEAVTDVPATVLPEDTETSDEDEDCDDS